MSDELVELYGIGGELVAYAFGGVTAEQARQRPGPGAWSLAELAAHLADSDVVGADRIKRVIAEPSPTLLAYDENTWTERLRAQEAPIEESLALFVASRHQIARILRACEAGDFARAGTHTEKGRLTLAELVAGYVHHLDYHLKYAYAKRANLGISLIPRYSRE